MPIVAVADPAHVPGGMLAGPGLVDVIVAIREAGPNADGVLLARDLSGLRTAWSARLACGEDRIGIVYKDMPPTAFYAVAAACQGLPEEALGLAGVAVNATLGAISTHTLLSSVTSVERPVPSFGQHLASLWPGTLFDIDHNAGSVKRVKTMPEPAGVALIIAGSVKHIGAVDTSNWPQTRTTLPAMVRSTTWQAARWIEVSALAEPVESILGGVLHDQQMSHYVLCSTCDRPGWGRRCIFCEVPFSQMDAPLVSGIPTGGLK